MTALWVFGQSKADATWMLAVKSPRPINTPMHVSVFMPASSFSACTCHRSIARSGHTSCFNGIRDASPPLADATHITLTAFLLSPAYRPSHASDIPSPLPCHEVIARDDSPPPRAAWRG